MLLEPYLSDQDLLADIQATNPGGDLAIWWLGQSGFLIKHQLGCFLLDPYLSDSLTRKYQASDRPHVRIYRRVVDPSLLQNIRLVTSSHNHTDHLDAETLNPILESNPHLRLVIPEANRAFVSQRLGVPADWPLGIADGQSREAEGIQISAVPAAHNSIDRDKSGCCRCLGYILKIGKHTIYHSGDTLLYPGMVELLIPHAIDVAILPINGNRPERGVAGNLFGDEAAQLAHDCGAKLVIPCHFDMFQFNTESPELFCSTCERLGQSFQVLACGQRVQYPIR